MKFAIGTFLNDGDGRFWGYEESDRLVAGPALDVEADSLDEALDIAWRIGNRMYGSFSWPSNVRSLSVGDVLLILDSPMVAYAIESVGFKATSAEAVLRSVAYGKVSERGGSAMVCSECWERRVAARGGAK